MPTTRDRLLHLLASRPGLAQHELADRLNVSTRTARRHLGVLETMGTVVTAVDGSATRYCLASNAQPSTPIPDFTDDEAEALAVAALAARPLLAPTPLAVALDAASEKLRAAALAEVLSFEPEADDAHWSFDGVAGGISKGLEPEVFRRLLDAAREGHAVRADYFTASRQSLGEGRTLGPLALMVRNGGWMVACLDLDADGCPVKDFALAGFRDVLPLPSVAASRPRGWSPETHAADRLGALDGPPETVRLWVSPEAAPYFARKDYSRTQLTEAEHADGSLTVSFETAGLEDARAFVMGWGAKVRVLDPPALAEAVAEAHRQAARRYGDE